MKFLIDGNAMLNVIAPITMYHVANSKTNMSKVYTITPDGKKLTNNSIYAFEESVLTYIRNIIYPFQKYIDQLFIVFDMPNWRKVYINWYFDRPENKDRKGFVYKAKKMTDASRERLENTRLFINYFHEGISNKLSELSGLNILRVAGAEGDDLLRFLCDKIDDDIVIFTVDSDIAQLVEKGKRSVIVTTPKQQKIKRKLYVAKGFLDKDPSDNQVADLLEFNMKKYNPTNMVETLLQTKDYDLHEIEPSVNIITKIIAGDKKSDNIPSIYTWPAGERTMSLTEKVAGSIMESLSDKYPAGELFDHIDSYDAKLYNDIIDLAMSKVKKLKEIEDDDKIKQTRKLLLDNLKLNTKLIRLADVHTPNVIKERMEAAYAAVDVTEKFSYDSYKDKFINF